MQQKHFLLYGHGGSYNHGGEAITRCTIDLLRKQVPDCFITLSTHFPEQDREFGLTPDEIITRNCSTRDNELMYRDTLERITSDTTVIQVGGDNYCYTNWQRYAQIHQKAKECGGKSILWGCSIDANAIDDEMLGILQAHDLILARECLTYRTLVKAGLTNVIKVSDIAFGLELQKVEFPFKHYIVLNLSPLVCRKNAEVLDAYRNLITLIMDQTDYSVVLLPHVVMPVDNDKDALDELGFYDNTRVVRVSRDYTIKSCICQDEIQIYYIESGSMCGGANACGDCGIFFRRSYIGYWLFDESKWNCDGFGFFRVCNTYRKRKFNGSNM